MKKFKFSTQFLMLLALISITLLQIYWLNDNYQYKQEQFELNVKKALYGFRAEYKKIQIKKLSQKLPGYDFEQWLQTTDFPQQELVKDLFSELKMLSEEVILSYAEIYNLLKSHLKDVGIYQDFEFCLKNKKIVYHQTKNYESLKNENILEFQIPLFPEKGLGYSTVLHLYFPKIHNKFIYATLFEAFLTLILLSTIVYIYFDTLNKYRKQKKITEVKNDFINNMTHELKTPIASIFLASQMLNEPKVSEKIELKKKYLDLIQSENKKLQNLVEKILQAAKWQKETFDIQLEYFSLNQLIEEVSKPFSILAEENKILFEVELLQEDIQYLGDKFLLHQAIQNLLDNAFKYGVKGKDDRIMLKIVKNNKNIEISVKDFGEGLTKEEQSHIFEQFYRVPKGNVHDVKGFGLGLYFVKNIIEAHKGTVKVYSEKEKGCNFVLYLPLL
jgi:two-component system phosphate regulon sensor histidine kinase PhoR